MTLAGNETKGSGAIRTFRTTQLKPGEQWSNYTVNVTAVINGQAVSKEILREFIKTLDIPDAEVKRLLELTPESYTGLAERLARDI